MSLQEQFQERYGKNAVNDLFRAFDFVKRAIMVVTWVAMGISYFHQKHYFEGRGAGPFAWVIPVSIDCVMLVFMKISQLPAIKAGNRWIARGILILPAGGSMAINYMATEDAVLRWVYVGVVGAIVICEIGHGLMVPSLASMEAKQAEMTGPAAVVAEAKQGYRVTEAEKQARKRAGYDRMDRAGKAAWSKAYRERTARRLQAAVPVSPAPAGMDISSDIYQQA
jgi:hypothetical protein